MTKAGLISIITPTYNRASLISRMISSVRNQDYENWELIIMDDGSSDNTKKIIDKFDDDRIRYFYTENSGAGDKRNQGVEKALGENIIFLDSDDEVKPNWLRTLLNTKELKAGNIVCCGWEKYGYNNQFLDMQLPKKLEIIFQEIEASFLAGTILLEKEHFMQIGGYDTSLESGQHTDLMLRLVPYINNKKLKIISVPLALIKVHDHSGAKIRRNSSSVYKGTLKILEKHKNLFKNDKISHFNYLNVAARAAFESKELKLGNILLYRSFKLFPFKSIIVLRLIKYNLKYLIA